MNLPDEPWKSISCFCLVVGNAARAWLDARKDVAAANERLELARAQKDITIERATARFIAFSASMPDAYEKFSNAVQAALAEPVDASAVEELRKSVDPYVSIFDELNAAAIEFSLAERGVDDAMKAERAAFAVFSERASTMRKQIEEKSLSGGVSNG